MKTIECIYGRRSVRKYKNDSISKSDITEVLNAAIQAPSAGNVQDWEFLIIQKTEVKKQLQGAALGQEFVSEAPIIIVVCSDLDRIKNAYGERGKNLYSIQDTAAAIQNLMLAACDKGIGTCWVGAFSEENVKKILDLPANIRPVAMITMGYPNDISNKSKRKNLDSVIHWDKW